MTMQNETGRGKFSKTRRRLVLLTVVAAGVTVAATVPPPESPLLRVADPGHAQASR